MHGKNLLGTVADDRTFCLMDLRTASNSKPAIRIEGHTDAINTLAFHQKHDVLFATGSADRTVGIFDMRFPEHGKIHSMEGHQDVVTKIEWHPHDPCILASSGDDRRVIFWDISRAGSEQTPDDAEDGPPEMYVFLLILMLYYTANMIIGCSCTAVTLVAFQTSAGTRTTHG